MALMFPTTLPSWVTNDPYRSAEIEVYNLMREEVPDDYVCYYSRPWLGLDEKGFERDGEADFVVAHPELGLLVIEVKGGVVSRDEGTEKWKTKNRLGFTNEIKDPVQQAVSSKYQLIKKLREHRDWGGKFITLRHGVILPDSARPERDLGINMPQRIFLFGPEMNQLQAWIDARLGQTKGEDDAPGQGLGHTGMRILHELVAGAIELRPSLARALRDDRRAIETLSSDQLDVLDGLVDQTRVAIAGGAGTGKTILALEKAARLGEAGLSTLLICFNAPLAEWLERMTRQMANVKARSFHGLCDDMAAAAAVDLPPRGSPTYFNELPGAMKAAISTRPDLRVDAIIVDEGQDFENEWLECLDSCLKQPEEGAFYAFYDDNQKVYRRDAGFLTRMTSPFYLTRNFRNTRAIHEVMKPWYLGHVSRAVGPQGLAVQWVEAERPQDAIGALHELVRDLIRTHGLKPDDIAVLTGGNAQNHAALKNGMLAGVSATNAAQQQQGQLVFDTVRRFKGLERAAVIIVDPGKLDNSELVYVALSRPSVFLAVIGGAKHLDRLKRGVQ
ncbi:hypothetical protein SZ64_14980 [Erythrobacter sp. SG61-1L]|uniref:NERD domain-containing protein n=1 Tax=Erythrobacter sp. SG61-1L TaxID=1603897 RepID=UPI0006C925EE|nr:NERD domain-containing protein/DEAD/DEAH box helicase [Erythrobacter sp. SG61-1L]KPL69293.1 hypothetical protein SZ64_14980 [Erythrobacter sp. SG61-1L]